MVTYGTPWMYALKLRLNTRQKEIDFLIPSKVTFVPVRLAVIFDSFDDTAIFGN